MGKFIDLSGKKFNRLTVVEKVGKDKNGKILWKCHCDCGNEIVVRGQALRRGDSQSCGCLSKENAVIQGKNKAYKLVGRRFGRLEVIEKIESKNNQIIWKCKCNCGNITRASSHQLVSGIIKSCGCLRKETAKKNLQKVDWTNYDFDKRRIGNKYTLKDGYVIIYASNTDNEIFIDRDIYDYIKKYTWAESAKHYAYTKIDKKRISLARFVMNVIDEHDIQITVDHINHNTLDNRRCNLRIANQSEQSMNQGIQCNNTSGITGVSWKKKIGKWQAQIGHNGKTIYLGVFDELEDAKKVRREAEIKYFGEYNYRDSVEK